MNLTLKLSLVAAVISLSACAYGPAKITGGGTMDSTSGVTGDKANFGFNMERCDLSAPAKGHVTFHDKNAPDFQPGGVRLRADVVDRLETIATVQGYPIFGNTGYCQFDENVTNADNLCVCPSGYQVGFNYSSQNPKFPGSGFGVMCVYAGDYPDPNSFTSSANVNVVKIGSGPFANYQNTGAVRGNLQPHSCK